MLDIIITAGFTLAGIILFVMIIAQCANFSSMDSEQEGE